MHYLPTHAKRQNTWFVFVHTLALAFNTILLKQPLVGTKHCTLIVPLVLLGSVDKLFMGTADCVLVKAPNYLVGRFQNMGMVASHLVPRFTIHEPNIAFTTQSFSKPACGFFSTFGNAMTSARENFPQNKA